MSVRRNFRVRESIQLELAADITNILNHTQLNGAYAGNLGATNTAVNAAKGLLPGMGVTDTFGTIGVAPFYPRQVVMNLRLRF
jgi:hypothetical protein